MEKTLGVHRKQCQYLIAAGPNSNRILWGDYWKDDGDKALIQVMTSEEFQSVQDQKPCKKGTWIKVSKKFNQVVGHELRTPQQLRERWNYHLAPRLANKGRFPEWSKVDTLLLAIKLRDVDFKGPTGFDWSRVSFHLWDGVHLKQRWMVMAKNSDQSTVDEILKDTIKRYQKLIWSKDDSYWYRRRRMETASDPCLEHLGLHRVFNRRVAKNDDPSRFQSDEYAAAFEEQD